MYVCVTQMLHTERKCGEAQRIERRKETVNKC